jgi:Zn-dependent protease
MVPAASRPLFRFRLAGIPVDVQPLFVLVVFASTFPFGDPAGDAAWIVVVAGSILWHELGHALTMRAFGFPPRIELTALGGLAHWPGGASPSAREALLVSAAGPGAGLLLGAAAWALERHAGPLPYPADVAFRAAIWVNVWWSLFNLLPLLPLDGARVLDHLSRLVKGVREPRWVGWTSLVAGGAVVLYGLSRQAYFIAFLGLMGASQGHARLRGSGGLWRAREDGPEAARAAAERALARGDLARAAAALLPEARLGRLAEDDLAELVAVLVRLKRRGELVALVRERLAGFARKGDAAPLARLAAEALAEADAHEDALAVAQTAFRQLGIAHHAYDAAGHLVRLGRHGEAVEWLGRAVDAGLDCGASLHSDPALAPLRERADFDALVVRAGKAMMA